MRARLPHSTSAAGQGTSAPPSSGFDLAAFDQSVRLQDELAAIDALPNRTELARHFAQFSKMRRFLESIMTLVGDAAAGRSAREIFVLDTPLGRACRTNVGNRDAATTW